MNKTTAEFESYFHKHIRPNILVLEYRRKRIVFRRFLIILMGLALISLAYVAIYVRDYVEVKDSFGAFFLTSLVVIVIGAIIVNLYADGKKFRNDFKKGYIAPIVKFVNPDFNYFPDKFIAEDMFNYSRLFKHYPNRFKGSDLIEGKIGNAKAQFSEVNAVYVLNPDAPKKNERKKKIFSGLFFVADFGTTLQKSTLVVPRSDLQDVFSNGSHRERTEQLVEVDYPEFSEYFTVYSEDVNEANLLLTRDFMQRILALRKKHLGRISISFVESCLYITISMSDRLLEPQVLKKLTSVEYATVYFNQIKLASILLDELNPSK